MVELDNDDLLIGGSQESNKKLSLSGFFNHIFNFNQENKSNIMNMVQYILIGIIPIISILKSIKLYIPEEDDNKGTAEITLEIALQLFIIFFAIWFIDRIIRYIPTYSGYSYHKFNEINFILPILIILITMQTKLGSKINILCERSLELWNGSKNSHVGNSNMANVRVSQPIVTPGMHQLSRADSLDNTIMPPPAQQMPAQNNISMIDALPNMMNQPNQNNGLNNFQNQAIQNSFLESMEPMAANGSIGNNFGSSY